MQIMLTRHFVDPFCSTRISIQVNAIYRTSEDLSQLTTQAWRSAIKQLRKVSHAEC